MSGTPNSIWKARADLFHRLYLQEDHTLRDVKLIAERDHNFPRTPLSTYEAKLRDELKLRKNLKPEEWAAIGRHLRTRPTPCGVFLGRVRIPDDKVKRYVRRYRKHTGPEGAELPSDVSITPLSDIPRSVSISIPESDSAIPYSGPRRPQTTPLTLSIVPFSHPSLPSTNSSLNTGETISYSLAPRPVTKHTHVLVDQVFALLKSNNNSVWFIQDSAPILDQRFAAQWAPLLDNLPIIQFQTRVQAFANSFLRSSAEILPGPASNWGPQSLRSLEEIKCMELMDAAELGLLPNGSQSDSILGVLSSPAKPPHFRLELSTFRNPFHALTLVLHHLSNDRHFYLYVHFDNFFVDTLQQVPESMLEMLFRLDCPTIRAARRSFLDWVTILDNTHLFRCLAETILQDAMSSVHSRLSTMLLTVAAWFGATDICKLLIDQTVPLDEEQKIYSRFKLSVVSDHYTPLAAAAVRGKVEVVELFLSAGALVNYDVDSQKSCPVEHLIKEVNTSNSNRDKRLHIMSLLLAAGTDIYCPADPKSSNRPYTLTLFDLAFLSGDPEISGLFREYLPRDHDTSQLSISGIILTASKGVSALTTYLKKCRPLQVEDRVADLTDQALYWGFYKYHIEVVSVMIQAGFSQQLLHGPTSLSSFIHHVYRDSPLTPESEKMALFILENYRGTYIERWLLFACLKNTRCEVWRLIVDAIQNHVCIDKVIVMALATRTNNFGAVALLFEGPFNFKLDAEICCEGSRYSILLLSSINFSGTSASSFFRLLVGSRPASTSMLEYLVQHGADISSCQPRFWSPAHIMEANQLMWLLRNGLLTHGPATVYSLLQPVMEASQWGSNYKDVLLWLYNQAVPIFSRDEISVLDREDGTGIGIHPLSFFIQNRACSGFIDEALRTGINPNGWRSDPDSYTPLEAAAKASDYITVSKLISSGVPIDPVEVDRDYTVLQIAFLAVEHSEYEVRSWPNSICTHPQCLDDMVRTVEILLRAGANPNQRGALRCCIPLLREAKHVEVIKLLLRYGADVNECLILCSQCRRFLPCGNSYRNTHNGKSILSLILIDVDEPRVDHVRTLLEGGARLTGDELGWACWHRSVDLVKLLLDWKADPNIFSREDGPALSMAALLGNLPIILMLLAAGAVTDPEVDDITSTQSPLVAAAEGGALDVVALLMELETRENVIECAISIARREEHFEVAFQLEQLLDRRRSESAAVRVRESQDLP